MMIRFLIIILIVLVGAAAFTTLNPSADKTLNPIMKGLMTVRSNIDSWIRGSEAKLDSAAKDPLTAAENAIDKNVTQVYKWQDANGEWHFSNEPPPPGIKGTVESYRNDVNVTQAPPPIEIVPEVPEQTAEDIPDSAVPLLPITDPERVKQLIDDAKNVQGLVDNRHKNID